LTGAGFLMPLRFANDAVDDGDAAELDAFIRSVNGFVAAEQTARKVLRKATGAGANLTILTRLDGADATRADEAFVALVNPGPSVVVESGPETTLALGDFNALRAVFEEKPPSPKLPPGAARLFHATRSLPIRQVPPPDKSGAAAAANAARIVITSITHASKRTVSGTPDRRRTRRGGGRCFHRWASAVGRRTLLARRRRAQLATHTHGCVGQ